MFSHIYLVSNKLNLVDPAEIDKAEQQLGQKMPPGYREFMTQLGIGEYCTFIEVYSPQQVITESQHWGAFWQNHWPKTSTKNTINGENIAECLMIAKDNSDTLLYHPSQKCFFIMDRDDHDVLDAGSTLDEALKAFTANRYGYPLNIQYFVPRIDRCSSIFDLDNSDPKFFEELVEAVMSLGFHDQIEQQEWEVIFFIKEISAYLRIDTGSNSYEVIIDYDENYKDHSNLEAITNLLESFEFELTFEIG
jgi:hypothetical protein